MIKSDSGAISEIPQELGTKSKIQMKDNFQQYAGLHFNLKPFAQSTLIDIQTKEDSKDISPKTKGQSSMILNCSFIKSPDPKCVESVNTSDQLSFLKDASLISKKSSVKRCNTIGILENQDKKNDFYNSSQIQFKEEFQLNGIEIQQNNQQKRHSKIFHRSPSAQVNYQASIFDINNRENQSIKQFSKHKINSQQQQQELECEQRKQKLVNGFKNKIVINEIDTLDKDTWNICYQQFEESLDNLDKKILWIKIIILQMQLNYSKLCDYIDSHEEYIRNTKREILMNFIIDYLLEQDMNDKLQFQVVSSSKKIKILNQDPKQLNQDALNVFSQVNLVLSQEINNSCNLQTSQQSLIYCSICLNYLPQLKSIVLSNSCFHSFCMKCIESYLNQRVYEGRVTHIQCAQEGCNSIYKQKEIQCIMTKKQYQQYLKIWKLSLINIDPSLRYCSKARCGSQIKFNKDSKIDSCTFCNFKTCFDCYMPAHKGSTCEQGMEKLLQQELHLVRQGDCPSCKNKIFKIQKENGVICGSCNYSYCWLCKQKYTKYHYKYYNICFGCPDMLLATIDNPTFIVKLKFFFNKFIQQIMALFLALILMTGYFASLLVLPILLPSIVFLYYKYDYFEKRNILQQFIIGILLLTIGIIGFLIWLIFCIIPGIFIAFSKLIVISQNILGYH